jgi:hypothetical protein
LLEQGGGDLAGLALLVAKGIRRDPGQHIGHAQRRPFRMSGFGRVQLPAVAMGLAIAQDEHGQPLVIAAVGADQLALVIMGHFDAVDGTAVHGVLDRIGGAVQGAVHRKAEALRVRPAAQFIDGLARDADPGAGLLDAAAGGHGLDELHLPGGGEPVMAVAQFDRLEVRNGRRAFARAAALWVCHP